MTSVIYPTMNIDKPDMMTFAKQLSSAYFQKRLREFADHELVGDVRGVGLIGRALASTTLAFCAPLIITAAQIDELMEKLGNSLDQVAGGVWEKVA